jgi:hypothetical protein
MTKVIAHRYLSKSGNWILAHLLPNPHLGTILRQIHPSQILTSRLSNLFYSCLLLSHQRRHFPIHLPNQNFACIHCVLYHSIGRILDFAVVKSHQTNIWILKKELHDQSRALHNKVFHELHGILQSEWIGLRGEVSDSYSGRPASNIGWDTHYNS